mmetsp:Transcript_20992/g.38482  ORF Transcript_20992/g.38482 Transcript_20992/m.38482 type:complete len:200 (-) Transcript_20992:40-639(-)
MVELNAFTAAIATFSSSSGFTPLTPTAPIHISLTKIGTPPLISTNGAESNALLLLPSETLAESSNTPVGLRNCADVFAFPTAISYDAGNASSHLLVSIGTPPASAMAIVTFHPCADASCSAASIAVCAAADVRLKVVCNIGFVVLDIPTRVLFRFDVIVIFPGTKLKDELMKHSSRQRGMLIVLTKSIVSGYQAMNINK